MLQTIKKNRQPAALVAALLITLLVAVSFASADAGPASQQCTWTHLVRPGDTLGVIARYYHVSIGDILKLNSQITNPDLIKWGTTLCVSNTTSAPELFGSNYIVQPGDTLSYLAFRFGLSLGELARTNGIGNPDLIHVGDTLTVPTEEIEATVEPTVEPTAEATVEVTVEATLEPTADVTEVPVEVTPAVTATTEAAG